MKNSLRIKRLVGMATLTAIVVVLQIIANYIKIGTVNITLALFLIAVGAILYGPAAGCFLGVVMGAMVIAAPDTLAFFMPVNAAATVILCLLKSGLAGFVCGWVYRGIAHFVGNSDIEATKKKIFATAIIVATISVPVVNTALFIVGASMFFQSVYGASSFGSAFPVIFLAVFGPNFAIEFVINCVLAPVAITVIKIVTRNYNLGFANDFTQFVDEE